MVSCLSPEQSQPPISTLEDVSVVSSGDQKMQEAITEKEKKTENNKP